MKNPKPNPNPPSKPEPVLKAHLALNGDARCIAHACGREIRPRSSGIYVITGHEAHAFCSPLCLTRTVLLGYEQQWAQQEMGGVDRNFPRLGVPGRAQLPAHPGGGAPRATKRRSIARCSASS